LPAESAALTVMRSEAANTNTVQEYVEPLTVAAIPLQVTPATPDRLSDTEPETETYGAAMLEPLDGVLMLKLGGVKSMFTVSVALAESDALSVAVPVTD